MNYLYSVLYFACPPWDAVPHGVLYSVKFYFGLRAASTVGIKSNLTVFRRKGQAPKSKAKAPITSVLGVADD